MKTTLNSGGQIGIPDEIRRADHLAAGDTFELERLTWGNYLLTKQQTFGTHFTVVTGDDGLPVIGVESGSITSRLVKEIESQMPC